MDDQEKKKRKKQRVIDKCNNIPNFIINRFLADIAELEPVLITELPDPKMYALTGHKKQSYSCHRGPIVDLKWLPEQLEVDKKSIYKSPYKEG